MIYLILAFITSILLIFISGSSSVMFFLVLFIFLGTITAFLLGTNNKTDFYNLIKLFYIVFSGYLLYVLIAYFGYNINNGFHIYSDQGGFFQISQSLGNNYSLTMIFKECFIYRIHIDTEGAMFLFGAISFIANHYFDGNSILLQMINVSFFAMLTNLFVYKILRFYVSPKQAFRYVLYYAFFSPLFYYSPWILRDVQIAFLFSIGIYLIHTKFSIVTLFLLFFLAVITSQFRLASGIFYLLLPPLYIYQQGKRNSYYIKILFGAIIISLVSFSIFYFLSMFQPLIQNLSLYEEYTSSNLGNGLASNIYHLPNGLKQIGIIIFSQFTPFPPWRNLNYANSIFQNITGLISFLSTVWWSYISLFLILSLSNSSIRKQLPKNIKIFILVFIFFLLLNTPNMTVRRLFGIYPLIYIVFVYIKSYTSSNNKMKLSYLSIITYLFLISMYIIIK